MWCEPGAPWQPQHTRVGIYLAPESVGQLGVSWSRLSWIDFGVALPHVCLIFLLGTEGQLSHTSPWGMAEAQRCKQKHKCTFHSCCILSTNIPLAKANQIWRFLKKLKIQWPYDPAIPLLGIYPKEMKSGSQRGICIPCPLQHYS